MTKQSEYSKFTQKVIEGVGGTYKPDAAAHLIAKNGEVSYIMKTDELQGLTFDFITYDELYVHQAKDNPK